MSSWWLLGGIEAVIVVGSYIEAKARRQYFLLRWAWWHLAIVWGSWLGVTWLVVAGAQPAMFRAAERTVVRSRIARSESLSVAVVVIDE